MITAIIRNKENTLILDLPRSIYDLYEKLQSVGLMKPPKQIPLTDNEDEDIGVKLFSDNDFGNHLLLTLNEENTLNDANLLTLIVQAADEDIKEALEQDILYDQYETMDEVVAAVRQMTQDAGPIKAVFFCPLVGNIDEGDGDFFTVGESYLADSEDEINDALKEYTANDENDILSGMDAASFGQNAYFYDAAEGLLTATILLVAEFCAPEKRHIVSVFKVIQELLAPSKKKGKNQFQQLMELLQTLKLHIGMGLEGEKREDDRLDLQVRIAEIDAEFRKMLDKVSADTVEAFDEETATRLMNEKSRLQRQLDGIAEADQRRESARSRLDDIFTILDGIRNRPMEYDDQIVRQLLECVVVDSKEQITVIFKGGMKVVQPLTD